MTLNDRLSAAVQAIRDELRDRLDVLNGEGSFWKLSICSNARLMNWRCYGRLAIAMVSRTMRVILLVSLRERRPNV